MRFLSRRKQTRQQPIARKASWISCAAVVADEQSFELVQPGEGALDDPAVAAEPGAVLGLAAGDLRLIPRRGAGGGDWS